MAVDTYTSVEGSSRQEKIEAQRQADREALLDEEQAQKEEEEQDEQQESFAMMRIIALHRQKIEDSERKLGKAVNDKATLWDYKFAFFFAILKDLLDLLGFSLPVISFIVTTLFTILIFIALYFAKTNKSVLEMRFIIRKAVIWITGFITESLLFGINFLPIQTLVVYLIYLVDKAASNEQIEKALEILENAKKI